MVANFAPTKLSAYTGLKRLSDQEQEGWVWQTNLPDVFACTCGRTRFDLQYLKDSMHSMLLKDLTNSGLGYVRSYGHTQVVEVVNRFISLLDTEKLEGPIQKFIENHPILLSRFHAKRLFFKPTIVGLFEADFALVDSSNQLWFIELEKPSLKLFKKRDAHPTQDLMHAYGQVTDWLHQYQKHPTAILQALGLRQDDIVSVGGIIVGGRSSSVSHDVLQRHLSNPPYLNIDFMTLDDLATSLLQISRKLA